MTREPVPMRETDDDLNAAYGGADPAETGRGGEPGLVRRIGPGLLLLFIVGDILGTGVYALTGKVAKEVGGAVWLPFLLAFAVAMGTILTLLLGVFPRLLLALAESAATFLR